MSDSKTQLIGGSFQDAEGNVLANGKLTFQLSQDAVTSDEINQIAAGITVTINLDVNGDVSGTQSEDTKQYIWGNDILLPSGTYYQVTAYTVDGQLAWKQAQIQTVDTGSTFDLGDWIPNVIQPYNPLRTILLQTNGITNNNQFKLNLKDGDNTTLSDDGNGGITFNSSGGGGGSLPDYLPRLPQIIQSAYTRAHGNLTITFSNTPSSGHILLFIATGKNQLHPVAPSGMEIIQNDGGSTAALFQGYYVFFKVAGNSEGTTYTFTADSDYWNMCAYEISNVGGITGAPNLNIWNTNQSDGSPVLGSANANTLYGNAYPFTTFGLPSIVFQMWEWDTSGAITTSNHTWVKDHDFTSGSPAGNHYAVMFRGTSGVTSFYSRPTGTVSGSTTEAICVIVQVFGAALISVG